MLSIDRVVAQPQLVQDVREVHLRQLGKCRARHCVRHQRAGGARREPAVRRRDAVLHPLEQRDQKRAHERAVAELIAGQLHDRLGQGSKRRMRHSTDGIDPHLVRHGDVGAARVGHHQRTARLPEVAFGIEMQHLRTHASIAGPLQDAAAAAADRIVRCRIAERELVVAVGVILVLARE